MTSGKWRLLRPSYLPLHPNLFSPWPEWSLWRRDWSYPSSKWYPSVPPYHCPRDIPRLLCKCPFCSDHLCPHLWMISFASWHTRCVFNQAIWVTFSSLHVFAYATPSFWNALAPVLHPAKYFKLAPQRSAQVLRPSSVFSMCTSIYFPRKLLSLKGHCPWACLSPLLTWTPWIQSLGNHCNLPLVPTVPGTV